jgi:DNA-binding transcriptional LysR family regulator
LYGDREYVYDAWTFVEANKEYKIKLKGVIQVNDGDAQVTAAVAGAGIIKIPRHLVVEELLRSELVPILSQHASPPRPPIYAALNFLALKTSTFVRFMQEKMKVYRQ